MSKATGNHRIVQLLALLEEDPSDPFIIYALGMEYMPLELQTAWYYFNQLLKTQPGYLPAYYQAARCLYLQGNESDAEAVLEKGITLAQQKNDTHTLAELKNALQNIRYGLDWD